MVSRRQLIDKWMSRCLDEDRLVARHERQVDELKKEIVDLRASHEAQETKIKMMLAMLNDKNEFISQHTEAQEFCALLMRGSKKIRLDR